MQVYLTLTRRELASYFLSMAGYVIIAATTFLMGLSFVDLLINLQAVPTAMPVTELFYITPFFWLILLLGTPVITMRLFALERFSGTFETLMTAPVSDLQVVLSKFTAALIFFIITWLPLLGCLQVVRYFTSAGAGFDSGVVGSTFLGIVLLGAMLVAVGGCASAMTRNQVVAAMLSLAFGVTIFLLSVLAGQIVPGGAWHLQVLAFFSLFDQMHDFARGIVDTRAVVFLASLTLFFLFLNLRIIESRRWK